MNFTQHQLFNGALKSAVASVTSVLIANCVDTPNPILSLLWFKHVGIAIFFLLVLTEARYWNQWANSGTEQPAILAIGQAKEAAKKTEAAIDNIPPAPKP
jgi:hypothetical protein